MLTHPLSVRPCPRSSAGQLFFPRCHLGGRGLYASAAPFTFIHAFLVLRGTGSSWESTRWLVGCNPGRAPRAWSHW